MTHAEAIQRLDAAIAHVRTFLTPVTHDKEAERNCNNIKQIAIQALIEVNASMQIQKSISDIFFGKGLGGQSLTSALLGFNEATRLTSETYLSGVQSTIDILQGEQERYKRLMEDEVQKENLAQQKRSNRIQIWTLICSIVAALAALYPIVKPLVEKIFN